MNFSKVPAGLRNWFKTQRGAVLLTHLYERGRKHLIRKRSKQFPFLRRRRLALPLCLLNAYVD